MFHTPRSYFVQKREQERKEREEARLEAEREARHAAGEWSDDEEDHGTDNESEFDDVEEIERPKTPPPEWRQFKGPLGYFWYNGTDSKWREPQAHKDKLEEMFKQGWAPRKCKWKEVEDKDGGAYYVNGNTALWEVPVEFLLFEMKKVREEEELKLRKVP